MGVGGRPFEERTGTGKGTLFFHKTFKQKNKTKKGKHTNKKVFTVKHARFVVSFETNSKS